MKPADPDPPREGPTVQEPEAVKDELRATVRVDPQPGGKMFQGVWLELDDGKRLLIAYRAGDAWRSFEDQAVLVTGHCYIPFGQSMSGTHYQVDRMRLAAPGQRATPLLAVGPEVELIGSFDEVAYPAGSKLAGSTDPVFRASDGKQYRLFGAIPGERRDGPVKVMARTVEPNLAYAAGPGGDRIWIASVHGADHVERPEHGPRPIPCP